MGANRSDRGGGDPQQPGKVDCPLGGKHHRAGHLSDCVRGLGGELGYREVAGVVEQARQPLYTTGTEERSGMGFTIMESFMSSLQVTSKPGKGTTVHMKRRIVQRRKTA